MGSKHITSSPHFPQSNGLAEHAVKTVKQLIRQSDDQILGLLNYRSTPLPRCGLSPAELLMERQLQTTLPQTDEQYLPHGPTSPSSEVLPDLQGEAEMEL